MRTAGGGEAKNEVECPKSEMLAPCRAMLGGWRCSRSGSPRRRLGFRYRRILVFAWGVLRLAGGSRLGPGRRRFQQGHGFAIPFNALDSTRFLAAVWVVR